MRITKVMRLACIALTACGLALGACGNYESCDPDQDLMNGICFGRTAPPDAAPSGPAPDAGPVSCDQPAAGYGAECTGSGATTSCPCSLPFCAAQPGQKGFCTKNGCDPKDAKTCPTGWKCQDLSAFSPGLTLCSK